MQEKILAIFLFSKKKKTSMKLAIIYPEELPSKVARSVSIINTAINLSKYIDTTLIYEKSSTRKQIESFYELNLENLKFLEINKRLIIESNKIFNFQLNRIEENFDFFYVRHIKQAKYLIEKKKRVIYECHEIFSLDNPKVSAIEKFVLEKSFAIIFHNKSTQKQVNKQFSLTYRQKVVYNGHSFNTALINKDFSNLDQLVYIGSLIPWKGVKFLIQCFNTSQDSILNIFGDGKDRVYLENLSNENTFFHGFKTKSEIEDILINAKICIIPNIKSRYSLFSTPIKLFEYLSFSNIVIAPDFSPIQEIIKDKENGFLFEAENCKSFLKTIEYIRSISPYELQKVSENAYETSRQYTWEKRAKNIFQFLQELR